MTFNHSQKAFLELLKAGLWEKEALLSQLENIDFAEVYRLAEEQSVLGLVLAGLEHSNVRPPQELLLQWIGEVQMMEQQNKAMNAFVAKLIDILRSKNIEAILVKGQGIAQCYERPSWRGCGDIDLLLSDDDYERAKEVLLPNAIDVEPEFKSLKHLGMTLKGGFVVELHGMLHSRLSNQIDSTIDEAQHDVFYNGKVRVWHYGDTMVCLPSPDNDVIFVFTHILKHFYIEGIGLRQIFDWCRLLWTYRDSLNQGLLESRIRKMGLMSEWKAFSAFAVDYLGMPVDAMPLYDVRGKKNDVRWQKKAKLIMAFVLETGNLGHNREIKRSKHFFVGKIQAAWFKMKDFVRHARVFPLDSVKFFWHYLCDGIQQAYVI